ncbi:hypothetical protein ACE6H2_026619 [Prunus campanulata]
MQGLRSQKGELVHLNLEVESILRKKKQPEEDELDQGSSSIPSETSFSDREEEDANMGDNNNNGPQTIQDFSMPQFNSRQPCIICGICERVHDILLTFIFQVERFRKLRKQSK